MVYTLLCLVVVCTATFIHILTGHDDVIKWKHFPRNWPFVRGIHRSPVNSPHKGQWHGALMFSLVCVWINDWVNNREAGDLRRNRAHYNVIVMLFQWDWNNPFHESIMIVLFLKQKIKTNPFGYLMWHIVYLINTLRPSDVYIPPCTGTSMSQILLLIGTNLSPEHYHVVDCIMDSKFTEIWIMIPQLSFTKINFKLSSTKSGPLCSDLNVSNQ